MIYYLYSYHIFIKQLGPNVKFFNGLTGCSLNIVFFLKFSELCQFCCSADVLPAWRVYTRWHRAKTGSGKYIKIFEKTQYLMNTLHVIWYWIRSFNLSSQTSGDMSSSALGGSISMVPGDMLARDLVLGGDLFTRDPVVGDLVAAAAGVADSTTVDVRPGVILSSLLLAFTLQNYSWWKSNVTNFFLYTLPGKIVLRF